MIYRAARFIKAIKHLKAFTIVAICSVVIMACKKDVKSETIVYNNDFETNNISGISNGQLTLFNGTHVLGRYNSGGFGLTVSNLPKHNLVEVSFDLYIHDAWDGNTADGEGPDIWKMLVDGGLYINTTFSNSVCPTGPGLFCPPQSYPANYLNSYYNPKSGAFRTDLPGVCALAGSSNGTTEYKITKTISHNDATLLLQCMGDLVQKNVTDQLCDESWSVDNITIKAITL